jgi:hypothetical protein
MIVQRPVNQNVTTKPTKFIRLNVMADAGLPAVAALEDIVSNKAIAAGKRLPGFEIHVMTGLTE